ncbi:MAG: hypothetical protein AB7S75_06315 [Desulfococcaceae bacterium]
MDIEHYGARMIAFDVPISIQTNLKKIENNGLSNTIFKKLKQIEDLKQSRIISEIQKDKLKTGNWILFDSSGNVGLKSVSPEEVQDKGVSGQDENCLESDTMGLFKKKERLLFQGEKMLELPVSDTKVFKPGALICSVYFRDKPANETDCKSPLNFTDPELPVVFQDLRDHQALSVTVSAKGSMKDVRPPYPVLNVQLEDNRMQFRDHYIDLNFTGQKTIIIPKTNAERLLLEFKHSEYNIKRALRYFDYGKIVSLNLRWMQKPESPNLSYSVDSIKAVCKKW